MQSDVMSSSHLNVRRRWMRRDKGIVQFPLESTTKIKHSNRVSDMCSIDNEMTYISIFAFYGHYFFGCSAKKINSQITSHFANNQPHPFQHSSRANRDQSSFNWERWMCLIAKCAIFQLFCSFALSLSFATLAPLSSVIDANIADGNSFSSYGHECLFFLSLALLSNPNNHNREIILPENGLI
jgi:hypothetical protein